MTGFHTLRRKCVGVGQDLGMGMKSLISFMTRNIPCKVAFMYGMWYDVCVPLHVHLGRE